MGFPHNDISITKQMQSIVALMYQYNYQHRSILILIPLSTRRDKKEIKAQTYQRLKYWD